jgi:hypothetical protein
MTTGSNIARQVLAPSPLISSSISNGGLQQQVPTLLTSTTCSNVRLVLAPPTHRLRSPAPPYLPTSLWPPFFLSSRLSSSFLANHSPQCSDLPRPPATTRPTASCPPPVIPAYALPSCLPAFLPSCLPTSGLSSCLSFCLSGSLLANHHTPMFPVSMYSPPHLAIRVWPSAPDPELLPASLPSCHHAFLTPCHHFRPTAPGAATCFQLDVDKRSTLKSIPVA